MKKATMFLASVVFSVSLILAILLTAIDIFAVNEGFYKTQYQRLDRAEAIGISEEELDEVTSVLLGYTKGERDDMDITASINGVSREVFNDREKSHMEDVRYLYLSAMIVRNIAVIISSVLLLLLIISKRHIWTAYFIRKSMIMFFIILALFLGIGAYAAIDFDSFWIMFHKIFFVNDLWLLDPSTDILILMVPSAFFESLVTVILATFGAGYILSLLIMYISYKSLKKRGYA
ncbi:MAG: TIGR01906 family membrane protein [Eubacteriales bacterium]